MAMILFDSMNTSEGFLSFLSFCGQKSGQTVISQVQNNWTPGKYFRSPEKLSMMSHSVIAPRSKPSSTPPVYFNNHALKLRPRDIVRLHADKQCTSHIQLQNQTKVISEMDRQRTKTVLVQPVRVDNTTGRYKKMYQDEKKANDLSKIELTSCKTRLDISQRRMINIEKQIGRVIRTYWNSPFENTIQCLQHLIQRMWNENTFKSKCLEVSKSNAAQFQTSQILAQTYQISNSNAQLDSTFGETIRTLVSYTHTLNQEISNLRIRCLLLEEQVHSVRVRQSSNKWEVLVASEHLSHLASSNKLLYEEIESVASQLQQQKSLRFNQKAGMQLYTKVCGLGSRPEDGLAVPESPECIQLQSPLDSRVLKPLRCNQ